ncbi:MAG: ZIP family metal transporter [Acidobacteria bacterium]|nr:ZIP family metal transporter [Acidobacteriota bacterium]MCW5949243.1 ZIP family metal transporter [Pyrinomonadaceae bacterium]
MSPEFLQILIFGTLAALGNVAGGMILFPSAWREFSRRYLRYLLALAAGFMLSVVLLEMFPAIISLWQQRYPGDENGLFLPMLLVVVGYLLTQFFEHTIAPHFHLGEEVHAGELIRTRTAYTATAGMLIHTFLDGMAIAAASQVGAGLGFIVFVAIVLHKFPEGFTIGSMILATGSGIRKVVVATSLLGFATLAGAVIFHYVGSISAEAVAYTLPLAGGVTLYVAASDLIPEVNHHGGHHASVSLSVFAGVALFFGAHFILHSYVGH